MKITCPVVAANSLFRSEKEVISILEDFLRTEILIRLENCSFLTQYSFSNKLALVSIGLFKFFSFLI